MPKWDHRVFDMEHPYRDTDPLYFLSDDRLRELTEQGWEVVSATWGLDGGGGYLVLRRKGESTYV